MKIIAKPVSHQLHSLDGACVPYLWSDVVRCATERSCCLITDHALLTHAKVSQLDMAFTVQQHVVQLQVSNKPNVRGIKASTHSAKGALSYVDVSPFVCLSVCLSVYLSVCHQHRRLTCIRQRAPLSVTMQQSLAEVSCISPRPWGR